MKIKQRLDTGMFFIEKENGELFSNLKGIVYFSDIRNAEKMKAHIERHSKPFELSEREHILKTQARASRDNHDTQKKSITDNIKEKQTANKEKPAPDKTSQIPKEKGAKAL